MTLIDVPVGTTDPSTPATTSIVLTMLQRDILLAELADVNVKYADADRSVTELQAAVDAAKAVRADLKARQSALQKGLQTP